GKCLELDGLALPNGNCNCIMVELDPAQDIRCIRIYGEGWNVGAADQCERTHNDQAKHRPSNSRNPSCRRRPLSRNVCRAAILSFVFVHLMPPCQCSRCTCNSRPLSLGRGSQMDRTESQPDCWL